MSSFYANETHSYDENASYQAPYAYYETWQLDQPIEELEPVIPLDEDKQKQAKQLHNEQYEELQNLATTDHDQSILRKALYFGQSPETLEINQSLKEYKKEIEHFQTIASPNSSDLKQLNDKRTQADNAITKGIINESQFSAAFNETAATALNITNQASNEIVRYSAAAYTTAKTRNVQIGMATGNVAASSYSEGKIALSNTVASALDPSGTAPNELEQIYGKPLDRLQNYGTSIALGAVNPALSSPYARAGATAALLSTSSVTNDALNHYRRLSVGFWSCFSRYLSMVSCVTLPEVVQK